MIILMLVRSKDFETVKVSKFFTLHMPGIKSKNLTITTGLITGRHPESGRVANMKCEEAYFVIDGEGTIHSEKGAFEIRKGDVYHFTPGEKYYTVGRNLKIVIINSPAWSEDQASYSE